MPELPCEQSDGYFILRDGAAGMFLASSLFPRSRETRKPKIEDLKRHRDELDEKFYLSLMAQQKILTVLITWLSSLGKPKSTS